MSFGVIGAMLIAILFNLLIYFAKLPVLTKRIILIGFSFLFAIGLIALLAWPNNLVFVRLENIFQGTDTSANGRIKYAFRVASDMVAYYQAWFGVGPGQFKILFPDMIVNFYHNDLPDVLNYRIPNSMAEMLATYGIYGFTLKIGLEVYFFFRLKIYQNLYSVSLFIFLFIYQFTGSFTVNIAELGIWAIVCQSRFSQFDYKVLKKEYS
jgi:hypothetical protein